MIDSPFRGEGGGGRRSGPQFEIDPKDLARYARIGASAIIALLILYGLNWLRTFYTDWLWFSALGYEDILIKIIASQFWLFLTGLLLFAGITGGNVYLFFRSTHGLGVSADSQVSYSTLKTIRRFLGWAAIIAILLFGVFVAERIAARWEEVLLFLSGASFGTTDPIFGLDIGFFVFTLPVLNLIQDWLLMVLITTGLLVGGLYYVLAQLRGAPLLFIGPLRRHLLALGSAFFVVIAVGHWLARYDLLYSTAGAVIGVGYTEAHASLPAYAFMTVIALLTAALLVYSISLRHNRLVFWGIGGWFVLNIVLTSFLPAMVQRLYVEPSEFAREELYLAHHIELTRQAYGLDRVASAPHPAQGIVDRETIEENQGTIQNVRLWDEGPLLESYNQIQFFRLYYDFLSVTTDRYEIEGELRQVMLSTRELSPEKLPSEAQRWVNRQLQFTHGYGVAMSPVTEVEGSGRPAFFLKDVPPQGQIPLDRPEIYYGLKSLDYVITNSDMQEFNYPGVEGPVYTHYQGTGGIPLSSLFRRFLFAWKFWDLNILISGEIHEESRIQFRRIVSERFSTLAPFLIRDRNPYVVLADGRLFWIQDAYTITNRYPYSARWSNNFNYIRNSVKGVINAYDGSVDFYVADENDPLLQAYRQIFPTLFRPLEEMPDYLRPHVRYPRDYFTFQVHMLLQYHMQDPSVFYNKEDQWDLPLESSFGRSSTLLPYYIVARLPDEQQEEFLLIQPFTPVNRHNLVAWIAARNDAPNYGELVLFEFPSGRHIDGPNQVEARIDNDPIISEQFTLWGQVGSEVSRGILLVIPIGDSILYAEPVFLRPETLEFPELRRIILADSRQVVMQPTMEHSTRALVGELPAVAPVIDAVPVEDQEIVEEAPAEPGDDQKLETVREGLREIADRLEELLQTLDEGEE